jgi:RNA polymerase sigma-70 factor (ECF subfamily)
MGTHFIRSDRGWARNSSVPTVSRDAGPLLSEAMGVATETAEERELLRAAQNGDEGAFGRIVEGRRGELHAHCYRMLGSVQDAEDAMQEAMLRAWRGLPRFEGRSSLRSWLYRIATNACLDTIGKRPKRTLPVDYAPVADPQDGPGQPIVETVWVEPYPDEIMEVEDGYETPEASYEQREAVELAFVAALQHLPPNQRAALIMREVLGFSAKETAEALDTTVASVTSALQRARRTMDDKTPEQSQQETLRTLGDERVTELIDAYVDAWQREDIDAVVGMLAEDATFSMPPLATWYGGPAGRENLTDFMHVGPLSGEWQWHPVRVRANGQESLAFYEWSDEEKAYIPFALNMLSFRGEEISDVTCFICRSTESSDPESYGRYPDEPVDPSALEAYFLRFGLPARLESERPRTP